MGRVLISGAARSGTAVISKVLTNLGYSCSHETVYGLRGHNPNYWECTRAEASWMALPYINSFRGTPVLLFREPLECISSLMAANVFNEGVITVYSTFLRGMGYGEGVEEATRYYLDANLRMLMVAKYLIDLADLTELFDSRFVRNWEGHNASVGGYTRLDQVDSRAVSLYDQLRERRFRGNFLRELMFGGHS